MLLLFFFFLFFLRSFFSKRKTGSLLIKYGISLPSSSKTNGSSSSSSAGAFASSFADLSDLSSLSDFTDSDLVFVSALSAGEGFKKIMAAITPAAITKRINITIRMIFAAPVFFWGCRGISGGYGCFSHESLISFPHSGQKLLSSGICFPQNGQYIFLILSQFFARKYSFIIP